MYAHSDARSKSKYLAYFLVQGDFRTLGTDVSCYRGDSVQDLCTQEENGVD
jgi:hypothetical protein